MKQIKNSIYYIVMVTIIVFVLSACGGDNWGIDAGGIPQCNSDASNSSVAILVPAGTIVKALADDTTMRVWHFSNSDKLICILTGSAVIQGAK